MPAFLLCPVLPSASFSWHAQTGSAGRCLCDAAVTTPSRFSGVGRPRRGTAKLQPGIWLQRTRGTDCAGARCAVLGFELGLPGIMRPLSLPTNAAGRAVAPSSVSAMVTYFK